METTIEVARVRPGRVGFANLLRAEWTKFRTVRGWVIATVVAVLVTVLIGLFNASHSRVAPCTEGPDGPACRYVIPAGPGGELVTDTFYFVHRPLTGLGIGTIARRGAGAVAVVITAVILPYLQTAAIPVLPASAADWLLRVTPAVSCAWAALALALAAYLLRRRDA